MKSKTFICLLLLCSLVLGGIGQTAGDLNFGKVTRGAPVSLTYTIVNTGNESFQITAALYGDVAAFASISPTSAIVAAGATQNMTVTVTVPADAEPGTIYTGYALVHSEPLTPTDGEGAAVYLNVRKDISVEAGEEVQVASPWLWIIYVIIALIIIVMIVYAVRRRKHA